MDETYIINIGSNCRIIGYEAQPADIGRVRMPGRDSGEWLDAAIPGDINDVLVQNGKMPDPRFDTDARKCYWVTAMDWWYSIEFDAHEYYWKKSVDLCLAGVDGHADIWVNGRYLGVMKNAFRAFRFDVSGILNDGVNEILVRFRSIDGILGGPRLDELTGWKGRRAFIRKPQFSFGWDWSLPLPSIGLEDKIWIEADCEYRFVDISLKPFVTGRVDFDLEVTKAASKSDYEISIHITGQGTDIIKTISKTKQKEALSEHSTKIISTYKTYSAVCIPEPKLWFPNGYGDQPLYDYEVKLTVGGAVADIRRGRFGLRECRIVEKPFTREAGAGFSFNVEINGELIFCKGANWIPLELWPGTIKDEQYEFYLKKAKEANFNMIRVWGGGIYERSLFYDLCSELGIMVWQDFMFASCGYPVDLLRDEIIAEAEYQIKRLRNYTCIVLWCGCNEDIFSWKHPLEQSSRALSDGVDSYEAKQGSPWHVDRLKDDPQLYKMILRGLTGSMAPGVPYVESSPQSRDDYGNIPSSGNSHLSCWKYVLFESRDDPAAFRKHFDAVCSFNSEFCIQGPCSIRSFKSFMRTSNLWPPNDAWTYHIQKGHLSLPHHEQTITIAGGIFGEIDSLEKYVKYGQAAHSEMMRAEFEGARRDRPNNGGTMVWMYNDCWPTSNWSIIDYYRQFKPSYYAAKRACAPLLPIISERMGKFELFFSNDTAKSVLIKAEYGEESLYGEKVWSKECRADGNQNSTVKLAVLEKEGLSIANGNYLYLDVKANGVNLPRVTYFPNGWKHIPWPKPRINICFSDMEPCEGKYRVRAAVKSDVFVRMCYFAYTGGMEDVYFTDNYFDLPAGCEHTMNIESKNKIDTGRLSIGHWLTDWG